MNVTVLSGAGISAESGLKTFRDADGLWEGHDVMKVASPQGWNNHQELVLDFYNQRRRQLLTVQPNYAHKALAKLASSHRINIVTQNVDDLHERAGSKNVLHLHGSLLEVKCVHNPSFVTEWKTDLSAKDKSPSGHQLRPNIVWFGEAVPMIEPAIEIVKSSDAVIIIGTSMQVYPAASLVDFAPRSARVIYLDPKASQTIPAHLAHVHCIDKKATEGIDEVLEMIEKIKH